MKRYTTLITLVVVAIFFVMGQGVALAQTAAPLFPVGLSVPLLPTPFQSDDKMQVVYELHVDSFRTGDMSLVKLEIFGGDGPSDAPLVSYQDSALSDLMARPGATQFKDRQLIGAGMRAVVFLWLTFNKPADVPNVLHHRLTFRLAATDAERSVEGARIAISKEPALVIGPPLRGYGWVARFASNTSFHRRGIIAANGHAVISQRFAIDWGKVGDDGKGLRAGDGSKNADAYSYGEDVIAVSDGIVAKVNDGVPENSPQSSTLAVPMTLKTVVGNMVVIDLGASRYALYAHLQPGSIKVKPGDRVKRGQLIGKVGNSGNATGPHLHFHITNSPETLEGEGLPYVINSFDVWGKETQEEFNKGETRPKTALKSSRHNSEFPSDSSILSFP
ncbi:MAG TPA: M23 family metallopeptidase [Pyrinomonadaceae bacterium]|jgi:hypothetical protein|nr:M23 family metallopeptidase [Pyrinomonadaceae bacterium]